MQKRLLVGSFLIISTALASADFQPVATVSSGIARANVYSSQVITFSPYQNFYIGTHHFDTESDTGLFLGGEMAIGQNWAWQVGLSYFENNSFIEQGNVLFFSDPAFNNLTYQYQIQSRRVSIETKIAYALQKIWHPYISASIGEAFNKAYQYTEYPVTSADLPMTQPFGDHTTMSCTYAVGFGVDVNITQHWLIGAGYRFVNLGNASLGATPLQSGMQTINNSHIHVNELVAQLSYVG